MLGLSPVWICSARLRSAGAGNIDHRPLAAQLVTAAAVARVERRHRDRRRLDVEPNQSEAGAAAPQARAGGEARLSKLEPAGERGIARIRPAALLTPAGNPFIRGEAGCIEPGHRVGAIRKSAAQLAERANAGVAPRGRHNHRVDHRPLDAVERRRLVPFVDDPDRHQHHARPEVEAAMHHQVDVGLLDRDLAGLFAAFDFDERVLDLDLRPELESVGKAMTDHQDEAVQIRLGRQVLFLIEVHLHVTGQRRRLGRRRSGNQETDQQQLPRNKLL